MKKIIFIIFIFIIQFISLVNGLNIVTQSYEQHWQVTSQEEIYVSSGGFHWQIIPTEEISEVPFRETRVAAREFTTELVTLIFQFFGIVVLLIVLIVLIQSLIEAK
ncbi:MAG: hypothetical protein QXD43_03480 [Candidatus Aenigmatarchaeota archaeon]